MRVEQINERRMIAEQVHRQSQQHFESLQARFQTVDLPRILQVCIVIRESYFMSSCRH